MSIGEVWKIESNYENFTDASEEFNGRGQTPVFPSVYSVYKTGRFAFSGSVNIVSGSGTVNYKNGLPSLERQVADLVPYYQNYLDTLIAGDITDYEINAEFSLRSYFPGLQFNVAYLIDSYWSVAAGMRIVRGKNHYKGSINSISVSGTNVDGVFEKDPVEYLRTVAENASEPTANELNNIADNLEDRITREIDAVQLGYGFTPVLSVNYAPSLYTNWAVKYEFKTKLGLTTDIPDQLRDIVIIDGDTVLVDGAEVVSDIPAMLSLGLTRRPSNRFMFYAGVHYYFDKPVDFDGFGSLSMEMIEKNSYELAFGAEYKLANALRISAGWLLSRPGVNKQYQEATRFSLASNTLGGGIGWRVSDLIDFNFGVSYTLYKRDEVEYARTSETLARSTDVKEYFDKRTFVIALGVDFLFGEN
jgi:long-subunit fatty acid transport protein